MYFGVNFFARRSATWNTERPCPANAAALSSLATGSCRCAAVLPFWSPPAALSCSPPPATNISSSAETASIFSVAVALALAQKNFSSRSRMRRPWLARV